MEKIFAQYLRTEKVQVSTEHFERLVLSHPLYPALVSVTDVLDRLGIRHAVMKIDGRQLKVIDFPYILHVNQGRGEFVIIDQESTLRKYNSKENDVNEIVFRLEDGKSRITREREKHFLNDRVKLSLLRIIALSLVVLAIAAIGVSFAWTKLVLMFTSTLGLAVGYLLFSRELGMKLPIVKAFCGSYSDSKCEKVLNSKDARIFGVKLSDAVMMYFLVQAVSIILGLFFVYYYNAMVVTLLGTSLLTIPVVIFSLYYQHFRAKTWCMLCTVVDAVLAIQSALLVYLALGMNSRLIFLNLVPYLVFTVLISMILLSVIVLLRKEREENRRMQMDLVRYSRIVYSDGVFAPLLASERQVDMTLFEKEMILGKPNAVVQVIMACNLHCNPCGREYKQLVDILSIYSSYVSISVRFLITSGNERATKYLMQYWLSNIYERPNQCVETKQLLQDWFAEMSLDVFQKRYSLSNQEGTQQVDDILNLHDAWIKGSGVTQTPEFFINGFRFPTQYRVNDLLALIPILADSDSVLNRDLEVSFDRSSYVANRFVHRAVN